MNNQFYREFEDVFRGGSDVIQNRLQQYLPIVNYVKESFLSPYALDLGCGRGEWLTFCKNNDISAKGIDLDEAMLKECLEAGFDVEVVDALAYLKCLDSESVTLISSFHMIEHLPFESTYELIEEAYRVLQPGGVILLETPNSENIIVGTNNFYIDPTHIKPIPNQLLSFVMDYLGFKNKKVLRVNGSNLSSDSLLNIIQNVSPDYSVLGIKNGKNIEKFNEIYLNGIGSSFFDVVSEYDLLHKKDIDIIKNEVQFLKNEIARLEFEVNKSIFDHTKNKLKFIIKKILSYSPSLDAKARSVYSRYNGKMNDKVPMSSVAKKIYKKLKK
ncbi:class I SAM-dependent methyltransferase [Marinomonas foliarum]|uniref:O-antigen chain-terminating methyltransferase n=1 Tax=Marinomonas foliarum TaxID=491950 RepID=A0A368ZTQ0_9GAMM|nr:class I SAM-dependent methyltransferase [Marinomonas foliarum]RCX00365.1 O-antigen chain-terminating methyltransferase [Marinomonas foliarum]